MTSYGYDAQGRQTTATDPDSRVTTTGYDAAGHVTSTKDPASATTTRTVDPAGQVTAISYSDGDHPRRHRAGVRPGRPQDLDDRRHRHQQLELRHVRRADLRRQRGRRQRQLRLRQPRQRDLDQLPGRHAPSPTATTTPAS